MTLVSGLMTAKKPRLILISALMIVTIRKQNLVLSMKVQLLMVLLLIHVRYAAVLIPLRKKDLLLL